MAATWVETRHTGIVDLAKCGKFEVTNVCEAAYTYNPTCYRRSKAVEDKIWAKIGPQHTA